MKRLSPSTHIVVSGWGMTAESVARLPKDVICAPISYYSAAFEPGNIYGEREYWGCPWLERDWSSSQYYYPYNVDLSETIHAYEKASENMKGFYALTWRLTDAVSPKMWYISKAPWYEAEELNSSEKVYGDYAKTNYGESVAKPITAIINQNEPFATDFAECQATPGFNEVVNTYPLMNIQSLSFAGKHGELMKIDAVNFQEKKGTKNAPSDEEDVPSDRRHWGGGRSRGDAVPLRIRVPYAPGCTSVPSWHTPADWPWQDPVPPPPAASPGSRHPPAP